MSKKLKGFSLAELLISLLVISIVLSAAIPTITKRTAQEREVIWRWSTDNNSTYFGLGAQQAVLIGTPNIPTGDLLAFMDDDYDYGTNNADRIEDPTYINNATFTTSGDKLVILKKSIPGQTTVQPSEHQTTNMGNSHISFYNIENGVERNSSNVSYAGRIAADRHNLAFGIGTLLHQENIADGVGTSRGPNLLTSDRFVGENTAIGHYALMANTRGEQNVAVGEKALSHNKVGSNNTALGFLAGNKMNATNREAFKKIGDIADDYKGSLTDFAYQRVFEKIPGFTELPSENTMLGSSSIQRNETGFGNTALGSQSLYNQFYGDENTSVGYFSLGDLNRGYGNTSVGANACSNILEGNYNVCIGNSALANINSDSTTKMDNFGLTIGSTRSLYRKTSGDVIPQTMQNSVPLITGHTQRVGKDTAISNTGKVTTTFIKHPTATQNQQGYYDKELIVNAKDVEFKPFNGGIYPTFVFTSVPGDINHPDQTGYGVSDNFATTQGTSGTAYFNLRFFKESGTDTGSVTMQFKALSKKPIISAFDPNKIKKVDGVHTVAKLHNLSFNELIKFNMPDNYTNPNTWTPAWNKTDNDLTDRTFISNTLKTIKPNSVGIIADEYTNTPGIQPADIFINNRLNVTRKASHVIDVGEYGTRIAGHTTATNGIQPFDVILNTAEPNAEDNPNLRISETSTRFNTKDNGYEFLINNSPIMQVKQDQVKISSTKFYIDNLTTTNKNLIDVIHDLDNRAGGAVSSDARLKNVSGDSTAGLAEINKIEVKNFTYKKDEKKTPHVGVIAQQLQKVFPNSVIKGDDGYLKIKTEEIFYAMVNSIKELCAKIQDLTAKIVGLDKRITELEAQNKMLLEQNKAFEKRLEKLEQQAAK